MNIWLCDLTYDQQVIAADTMPTNIGYLAAYILGKSNNKNTFRLFKYPSKLVKAIDEDQLPDIIGFSHFVWNSALDIEFAKKIKKLKKNIVVVFGGLQYPEEDFKKKNFLEDHKEIIDFYVYKEGEIAFLNLVNLLHHYNLDIEKIKKNNKIVGVHYRIDKGEFNLGPPAQRVKDLMSIPSPYLTGLMDEFFDENLMPVLTTNRGCPFTCTFCAEGNKYYSIVNKLNVSRVRDELTYIAKKITNLKTRTRKDVYISDSNFGMYKEDLIIADVFAEIKKEYKWPEYILATTGKNHKTRVIEVSNKLEGDLKLSGSVQSLDPVVQKNIKRENINTQQLMDLSKESLQSGANTYSEMILGLPGDSLAGHKKSLEIVINAKYSFVLSWQLVVLKGTEIDDSETREKFKLQTKYRVLNKSYGNYEFINSKNLAVAEIEEIVVGGKDLSFEDYINARIFHLVINIFYNDNFLYTFMKIIDDLKINRYDWVNEISLQCIKNKKINGLFEDFKNETKSELWDNKEDVIEFVSKSENIKKFIDGEYGANLLAKYRIIAVTKFMREILNIAKNSTKQILIKNQISLKSLNLDIFLNEVEQFEFLKKKEFFVPDLKDEKSFFEYDIIKFLDDKNNLSNFSGKINQNIKFYRKESLNKIIKRGSEVYGTTYAGIYKQITRSNISKLYRDCKYEN